MARRKTHIPLNVFVNNRLVGRLDKETSGAIRFQYHQVWLDWEHRFALSLSLPLRTAAYRGEPVVAVFDNPLPDSEKIMRRLALRTGAPGIKSYRPPAPIGRDCVGAMQVLPADIVAHALAPID